VAQGATVLHGGSARPDIAPFAFEPTVLENVTEDMMLCRGELLGLWWRYIHSRVTTRR